MEYKVVITERATTKLDGFVRYLLYEKKNGQAATNVLNDFEATKRNLAIVAGSLKLCDNPGLKALGYRRINFLKHQYYIRTITLFSIENRLDIKSDLFFYVKFAVTLSPSRGGFML